MTPRKRSTPKSKPLANRAKTPLLSNEPRDTPISLEVLRPHAAGIDVHSDTHWVCVGPQQGRQFGAYTSDLRQIAQWLRQCQITTVAMESTGVYWIALHEYLESQGFEVFLVEPGQLSSCGARPKTDRLDCQWIQRLHTYGLLKGSFRPPDSILALRAYHRQRQMLIRFASMHVQHMQKALEQMNIKLTEVISDLTGLTGMSILNAILEGERDPSNLAALRHIKCAKTEEEIAWALEGFWREEHLFELKQAKELYEEYQRKISECDQCIQAELANFPVKSGEKPSPKKPRARGRKSNDLRFDATGPLFQALGVDLTRIEGIEVGTALVILSEIGVDVSKFPTEKHFCSWLGLCPRNARSNQTEKKRSPRKGKHRVKQALRMCAQAVGRTQTPLGMFYRRIRSRSGGANAITATAHKMARLIYRLLAYGREYVEQGMEAYETKLREKQLRSLAKKASELGMELTPKGKTPEGSS